MSECVYNKVSVTFVDEYDPYECLVSNINDYDHEIEIETAIPTTRIRRGWMGDILCKFSGYHIEDGKSKADTCTWIKNVLCARVKTDASRGEPIFWTYCFLKD